MADPDAELSDRTTIVDKVDGLGSSTLSRAENAYPPATGVWVASALFVVATWAHHENVFEAIVIVVISTHSIEAPVGSSEAASEASDAAETGPGRLGMGARDIEWVVSAPVSDSVHGVASPGVEVAAAGSSPDALAFHPLVGTAENGAREEPDVPVGSAPDLPPPEVSSHGTEPL